MKKANPQPQPKNPKPPTSDGKNKPIKYEQKPLPPVKPPQKKGK